MIKRIGLAGIWVKDQYIARKFYVEKLGFDVQMDIVMENGYRCLEVVPPGADTALILVKPYLGQKDAPIGVFANLVISCDDILSMFDELKSKGVNFIEEKYAGWGNDASPF
jgi:lactoylglutathione lyase